MYELTPDLRRQIVALHKRTSLSRYDEVFDPRGVRNPLLPRKGGAYLNMKVLSSIFLDDESTADKINRHNTAFLKSMECVLAVRQQSSVSEPGDKHV